MSITLDRPVADTASDAVTAWLQKFEKALTAGDAKAAAGLFVTDGFWRDFLSFTWNLKTCESPAEIEAMLEATLGTTKPQKFHIAEPADAADGIISAWINFETAPRRARRPFHARVRVFPQSPSAPSWWSAASSTFRRAGGYGPSRGRLRFQN